MFVFLVSRARCHTDLFSCVGGNFISAGRRGVGDFGRAGGTPGLGLGFCFVGGGRGGFVGADFAEVEFLDGVLVTDGSCSYATGEEWRAAEGAHTGNLEKGNELALRRGEY